MRIGNWYLAFGRIPATPNIQGRPEVELRELAIEWDTDLSREQAELSWILFNLLFPDLMKRGLQPRALALWRALDARRLAMAVRIIALGQRAL